MTAKKLGVSYDESDFCSRCQCCSAGFEECWQCGGDGVFGHDCGEDSCCCLEPEDDEICEICGGVGAFKMCLGRCNSEGKHELAPASS